MILIGKDYQDGSAEVTREMQLDLHLEYGQ